jgi:hypothetical protein
MKLAHAGIFAILYLAGIAPPNVNPLKPRPIVPAAPAGGCPVLPPAFLRSVSADPASRLSELKHVTHPDSRNAAPIGKLKQVTGFSLEIEAMHDRPSLEIADGRLEAVDVIHEGDRLSSRAVRITCPANALCRVPGLVARHVAYEVESVRWTAGAGWPEYRVSAPSLEKRPEMLYPNALVHQVVLTIGGDTFGGCPSAGTAATANAGEVSFAVNDDKYDDNEGGFSVLIYGWE